MALNTPQLKTDLEDLFANADLDPTVLASQWQTVLATWAKTVLPATVPATVDAAAAALSGQLIPIFSSTGDPASKGAAMDAAFQTFALGVGGAMAPAFVGTPPASPPGFVAGLAAQPVPDTHADAADVWGTKFHDWFITGIATPPVGPVVPWS